jgi:diaminopimelate decarboxylase
MTDLSTPDRTLPAAARPPGAAGALRMAPLQAAELAALQTPAYVFDASVVVARYAALRAALGTQLVVSLKANSLVDLLLRCGAAFVDGVELASVGELEQALPRVKSARYVNNPSMDEHFMRAALVSGCIFIVDSLQQAERLAQLPAARQQTRVLLRLNIGVERGLADADQFGMGLADALRAGRLLQASGAVLLGVHAFAGSHRLASDGIAHVQALAALLPTLEAGLGQPLDTVNLGGGFAEDWEDHPAVLQQYVAALAPLAARRQLVHESGRGIFGRAGAFVTRVVATKRLGERRYAVCDGGIAQSFLLAGTENLLRRPRQPHTVPERHDGDHAAELRFVGSSCSRQDLIGRITATTLAPSVGDHVVFEDCGAYHSSYTVSSFLRLPAARQYLRADVA